MVQNIDQRALGPWCRAARSACRQSMSTSPKKSWPDWVQKLKFLKIRRFVKFDVRVFGWTCSCLRSKGLNELCRVVSCNVGKVRSWHVDKFDKNAKNFFSHAFSSSKILSGCALILKFVPVNVWFGRISLRLCDFSQDWKNEKLFVFKFSDVYVIWFYSHLLFAFMVK